MDEKNTTEEYTVSSRTLRERVYDWLYDHHVTVKMMDIIIAGLVIFGILVVVYGLYTRA